MPVLQSISIGGARNPTQPLTSLRQGAALQLAVWGAYDDGSQSTVMPLAAWTSSDATVITVSSNGLAQGVGQAGATARVTATVNGLTAVWAATLTNPAANVTDGTLNTFENGELLSLAMIAPSATARNQGNPGCWVGGFTLYNLQVPAVGYLQFWPLQGTNDGTYNPDGPSIVGAWSVDNPAIATVDDNGTVYGVSAGTTTLRASYTNHAGQTIQVSRSLTVVSDPALAALLVFDPARGTGVQQSIAIVGTPLQLKAQAQDNNLNSLDVSGQATWTSLDPSICTVSASGVVTGVKPGATVISASYEGVIAPFPVLCQTNAVSLSSLHLTVPGSALPIGTLGAVSATGTYSDGSTLDLTRWVAWSSSSPDFSVRDPNGSNAPLDGYPLTPGALFCTATTATASTTLTATFNGVSASATVTAVKAPVAITIPESGSIVAPGYPLQLSAFLVMSDGSTVNITNSVTWSAAGPSMSVSSTGRVSASAVGPNVIMAVYPSGGVDLIGHAFLQEGVASIGWTLIPSNAALNVGDTVQFQAIENYSDGTSSGDRAYYCDWVSDTPAAFSVGGYYDQNTGLATCLGPGAATITAYNTAIDRGGVVIGTAELTNGVVVTPPPVVFPPPAPAPLPVALPDPVSQPPVFGSLFRSPRLQTLLNYFDSEDVRMRELPYTLDAQLLNGAAMSLDEAEQRLNREIASRTLATCPLHLDNRGVYYQIAIPNDFPLSAGQTTLDQVTAVRDGRTVVLTPFDDRLPVPAGYRQDPDRARIPLADPVLFDQTGSGDPVGQTWTPALFGPFSLATPNRLTFFVEGVGAWPMTLEIFIRGHAYPEPVWADQQTGSSETLVLRTEGHAVSKWIWQDVTAITVRGLPQGTRLRCWQMPVNLPAVPDPDRPFTHPTFRDMTFDRYWQVSEGENLLKELYMLGNLSTLEYVQSYYLHRPVTALALEPHTAGLLTGSGAWLIYGDRREPLPEHLEVTALRAEPLFGLDCYYDIERPGPIRFLRIRPVPYGQAGQLLEWRLVLTDPAGNHTVILPQGVLGVYSGGSGWQTGTPAPVSLPLMQAGTYVITMECMAADGTLSADSFPYPNLAGPQGAAYDLSTLVPNIAGLAYDALEQLWIWDGAFLVPVVPFYDGYLLDAAARNLYVTQQYDSVSY